MPRVAIDPNISRVCVAPSIQRRGATRSSRPRRRRLIIICTRLGEESVLRPFYFGTSFFFPRLGLPKSVAWLKTHVEEIRVIRREYSESEWVAESALYGIHRIHREGSGWL